ncbi:MAG: hypothetical protein Nkreftii_000590 [Candidatus Nitrospira kreftii]|uniref:DUF3800 domain-containing protein n=1 Tax=Candidatus Nitrospira kreftii TaxID=2652173 RepID=A0A7S8FBK3_9BACT|nr:MAG: hypothetical protein Nkreftii_000590 [Candidatus Nitrospira kreftii]
MQNDFSGDSKCILNSQTLYIFLDEGGNLDFSASGTKFFTVSTITKLRPFSIESDLLALKYDLLEEGLDLERFHASEDKQAVRDRVFSIIGKHLTQFRIDSLIVEKRKTQPQIRDQEKFYPAMLGYLLKYVFKQVMGENHKQIIVKTDQLPLNKKRKAFEKAIKTTLADMLPNHARYRVLHHESRSSISLQVADYCNWAIYKKWTTGDSRSYDLIKEGIKSEFDIFRTGKEYYY